MYSPKNKKLNQLFGHGKNNWFYYNLLVEGITKGVTMMITKYDDKGDDKKLRDQSKNNSSES